MPPFLARIELSLHSLLVCMLVPLLYYAFQLQAQHWPYRLKRGNSIFVTIIIVLLIGVSLKMKDATGQPAAMELVLLHYIPLVLGLFIFFGQQRQFTLGAPMARGGGATAPVPRYAPVPLNKEVERISWSDLIVSDSLKEELGSIIRLLKDPKIAEKYGIDIPKGILFNGPPGTGKTTIAKVVASQAGLAFFALKADEVISKWVGDSEKNLSGLFEAAKKYAPAVIFIDEIDSIGKQRSGAGGQEHRESFLNHLLQLLDGIVGTKGIYVIGATNRADLVDAALKRPGRLNKVVDIPLPDLPSRKALFQLYLRKIELADEINIEVLAKMTDSISPAVIKEICNQAGLNAFKRESNSGNRQFRVTRGDIELALAEFI